MPTLSIWGLIVALALLAFGLTLEITKLMIRLKSVEKDNLSLESKLAQLQKDKDETISRIQQEKNDAIEELAESKKPTMNPIVHKFLEENMPDFSDNEE